MQRPPKHTPHPAYVLAAKLRNLGVYASAQDVREWPSESTRKALAWVSARERGFKVAPWLEHMGADLPPASRHSWLPLGRGG